MKRGTLRRRFLELLRKELEAGETKPSTRKIFKVLIDEGTSKAQWYSVKDYGPGAKWSHLRDEATKEWQYYKGYITKEELRR